MNYSDSIKAILLAAINDLSKTPEKYFVKPQLILSETENSVLKIYADVSDYGCCFCIREELYRFFGRTIGTFQSGFLQTA